MPDVYTIVTEQIIERLEAGTVPWQQPWDPEVGLPRNGQTGHVYRGINTFLLSQCGYASPFWYSFKQIKARGGSIRKGERSTIVVFWKLLQRTNEETGERKTLPLLRYYRVFNQQQAAGIPQQMPPEASADRPHDPIAACEALVDGYPNPPAIREHQQGAFYRPSEDTVYMPRLGRFATPEDYYSTLFHELVHSSGHRDRLDRPTLKDALRFGDTNYSKEELVAEMGAAYLCGHAGIGNRTVDQSASYLDHWLHRLRQDRKLLVHAASQAQKAVDHIRGKERQP